MVFTYILVELYFSYTYCIVIKLPIIDGMLQKTLTMEQDAEGYENAQSLGQFLVKNIQLAFFYPSGFRITISGEYIYIIFF